jgi:hypothetical protein
MIKVEANESVASLPFRMALNGIIHRLKHFLSQAHGLALEPSPQGDAESWLAQRWGTARMLIQAIHYEVEAGQHHLGQWTSMLSRLSARRASAEGEVFHLFQPTGEPVADFLQRALYLAEDLRRNMAAEMENAEALSLASSQLSRLTVKEGQSDHSLGESNSLAQGNLLPPPSFIATSWPPLPPPELQPALLPHSRTPSPIPPPIVQLPKVRLLEFSGDPAEWPQFYQVFDFAVHSNPDLPDHIKLSYLLGQLVKGSAPHSAVSGYDCNGENYPLVVEALQQRFGDPRRRMTDYWTN